MTVDAEDVETVGGLLAHGLGRVPIAGSEVTAVAGLRLTAENLAAWPTSWARSSSSASRTTVTLSCVSDATAGANLDPEDQKIITLAR